MSPNEVRREVFERWNGTDAFDRPAQIAHMMTLEEAVTLARSGANLSNDWFTPPYDDVEQTMWTLGKMALAHPYFIPKLIKATT